MQREDARELFSDYITGELDRAKTVALENHLNATPESRDEVEALRRVWETLDQAPVVEPPAFFHDNLMRRLEMEAEKAVEAETNRKAAGWNWKQLFRPKALALTATLGVLVLSVTQVRQTNGASLNPIEPILKLFRSASAQGVTGAALVSRSGGQVLSLQLAQSPAHAFTYTVKAGDQVFSTGTAGVSSSTVLEVPLTSVPDTKTVEVTLTDTQTQKSETVSLPLTR